MAEQDERVLGDHASLDRIMEKVRKLVTIAEHPSTSPEEARAARAKADGLMLAYAIREITEDKGKPLDQRAKPTMIRVAVANTEFEHLAYVELLLGDVARHCRCKVRYYSDMTDDVWYARVYGFESDVRYFEHLYTTLRLHMLDVFLPRVDPSQSLEENCYRLHSAGHNWLEIAHMYGWRKMGTRWNSTKHKDEEIWRNKHSDEERTNFHVGGIYKRAYLKGAAAHGESHKKISAGGSATYRRSAAQGYVDRIQKRLYEIESGRHAGAEVELRSRYEDLQEFFFQENPDLRPRPPKPVDPNAPAPKAVKVRMRKYTPPPFNGEAYAHGVRVANTANLNTNVGGTPRKEVQ